MYRKLVWALTIGASGFMSCSKIDLGTSDRETPKNSYQSPLPTVKSSPSGAQGFFKAPPQDSRQNPISTPESALPTTAAEVSGIENASSTKAFVGLDPSKDCAKYLGLPASKVKSLTADGKYPFVKGEGLAFTYHGNNGDFATNLTALAPGGTISGHCIYLDGSQNQVLIEVGIDLPKLKIVSLGRKTDITVHLSRGASLGGIVMDVADSDSSLYILGNGSYDCAANLKLIKAKIDVSCSIF